MPVLRTSGAGPPSPRGGRSCGRIVDPPTMIDERELNPQALGDHIDRLYRAARSLCGSREEAEDLVQETFLRVLAKPRILHSEDELGYLLRVLRNPFISTRRAAARRPQITAPPETLDLVEDRRSVQP